jgi:2-haloacid dehalogenase
MKFAQKDMAIVFDFGGVLIEWNPRHLYRKLFSGDEASMEHFLAEICTPEWNAQMDRGWPFANAVQTLIDEYPNHRELIAAYHQRWEEMIPFSMEDTVDILADLKQAGYPLFALSNWSAETFPLMQNRYAFLSWFELIVLSGEERVAKPNPAIFRVLLDRINWPAGKCLFIDDSEQNINAAQQIGFHTIHFRSAKQLRRALFDKGLLATAGW